MRSILLITILLAGCSTAPAPYWETQKLVWRHVEATRNAQGKVVLRTVEDARMPIVIGEVRHE